LAWNYGVSYLQKFNLFDRKGNITFDYYRTDFVNQVVVDRENPQEISFYNLKGKSNANSIQIEVNYELLKRLNLRTAYKMYDVATTYETGTFQRPMRAKKRFFANLSYDTEPDLDDAQWKFDVTYNRIGKQRLPNTSSNPSQYQLAEFSDSYSLLNSQITKVFSKKFEIYVGAENLTNYKQKNPILASDKPFGANFDTTIVYGPIFGSSFYTGLRFKID
jgi:outer membrane receptor for ferrienterochelin and colicin